MGHGNVPVNLLEVLILRGWRKRGGRRGGGGGGTMIYTHKTNTQDFCLLREKTFTV